MKLQDTMLIAAHRNGVGVLGATLGEVILNAVPAILIVLIIAST